MRREENVLGRSVTTRMPRESGPKAERREEKGTVPALRSFRETVTGCACLMDAMALVLVLVAVIRRMVGGG